MSFASYEFLFGFLPLALAIVLTAEAINRERLLLPALILVSAGFYGYGSIPHLILLLMMIGVTWVFGTLYVRSHSKSVQRIALILGIVVNVAALTIWKYGNSLVDLWNQFGLIEVAPPSIIMPLGISFYAFQQIGYLLDVRRGRGQWMAPIDYLAFVLFFPQLIAGPIVTQRRMSRELGKAKSGQSLNTRLRLAFLGMGWFSIGLFKKVVLADGLGRLTLPIIEQASFGPITMWESLHILLAAPTWVYFDFSGYSDMAVGLALLFGMRIPANFNAPYRVSSMRQSWTRWHITFHQFVRDHVYGPLMRRTKDWRFGAGLSLLLTVLLSSIWHGNSVQFLLWGFLVWGTIIFSNKSLSMFPDPIQKGLSVFIICCAVGVVALIFIVPDIQTAGTVLGSLVSLSGIMSASIETLGAIAIVMMSMIYCRQEISTQILLESGRTHRERSIFGYRPPVFEVTLPWIIFTVILLFVSFYFVGRSPAFVYFGI